eukprot:jgi/Ulvmu1/9009/UM005_0100.1
MNVRCAIVSSRSVYALGATRRRTSLSATATLPVVHSKGSDIRMDEVVQKSPSDNKSYRYLVLPNGLRSLLISDPDICIDDDDDQRTAEPMSPAPSEHESDDGSTTSTSQDKSAQVKKAAAAMAVGVGSFADPSDMQGLSHYLEHMLFMGSAEFPGESEYTDYLAQHAGTSNAYTEAEHTNYHLDIKPGQLRPALERFAAFFKQPLCSESALEREVCAVDSEFVGVSQNDSCRLSAVTTAAARPGHPLGTFMWGNKRSLYTQPLEQGIPIRDRIMAHYREHYSASRMCLAVLGGHTLDELQAWVQELFAPIENKGLQPLSIADRGPPFAGARAHLVPALHEGHTLKVTWQLPPVQGLYRKKAEDYWSHLLGHEGPGSLLSALKARKWATTLYAGVGGGESENNSGFALFEVEVTLTGVGLHAGPGLGLAVVQLLCQYLHMLKAAGPQEWVWRESKLIADCKFRFKQDHDAMDTVTNLVSGMLTCEPEHILSWLYMYEEWDEELVRAIGRGLAAGVDGFTVDLQSSSFELLQAPFKQRFEDVKQCHEPWFEFDYLSGDIPRSLLEEWCAAQPGADLKLPPPNPFITADLDLLPGAPANMVTAGMEVRYPASSAAAGADEALLPEGAVTAPDRIIDKPGQRLFHKLVTSFGTPRAVAIFKISSPALLRRVEAHAKAILLADCLEDAITEVAYQAELVGLHSHVSYEDPVGLELTVSGFSAKLVSLATVMFKALVEVKAAQTWEAIKENRLNRQKNAMLEVEKHCHRLRLQLLLEPHPSHEAVSEALEAVAPSDIESLRGELLQYCHIEALVEGNMSADEAQTLMRDVAKLIPGARMPAADRTALSCHEVPLGTHMIMRPAVNAKEANSAMQVYLQLGKTSLRLRALQLLCEQVVKESLWHKLRTEQQLGYSVGSSPTDTAQMLGFLVAVSSEKRPEDVEQAVSQFLDSALEDVKALSVEAFEDHVESVSIALREAPNNVDEQADHHWRCMSDMHYNFYKRYQVDAELHRLSHDDLVAFYAKYIISSGETRRKLVVASISQSHGNGPFPLQSKANPISDIDSVKAGLPVCVVRE